MYSTWPAHAAAWTDRRSGGDLWWRATLGMLIISHQSLCNVQCARCRGGWKDRRRTTARQTRAEKEEKKEKNNKKKVKSKKKGKEKKKQEFDRHADRWS